MENNLNEYDSISTAPSLDRHPAGVGLQPALWHDPVAGRHGAVQPAGGTERRSQAGGDHRDPRRDSQGAGCRKGLSGWRAEDRSGGGADHHAGGPGIPRSVAGRLAAPDPGEPGLSGAVRDAGGHPGSSQRHASEDGRPGRSGAGRVRSGRAGPDRSLGAGVG
ncbi:hypothetical protein D9M68_736390 [compost metagenome]